MVSCLRVCFLGEECSCKCLSAFLFLFVLAMVSESRFDLFAFFVSGVLGIILSLRLVGL